MTMNIDDPARLNGTTVIGGDGEKLGSVDAVYYDNATDRPEWVAVRSGLFGTRVALVPLRRANYAGDALRVPFDKVQLKNAPHHDPGRELSSSDEADLYRYYGIDYGHSADDAARTHEFATGRLTGLDRTDRTHDERAMTRSEERMRVGTASEEVGSARLRKHVVTEHQQVTVPVSHEEVRVEREPHTVDGDVRKERIEFDVPQATRRRADLVDTDADMDADVDMDDVERGHRSR